MRPAATLTGCVAIVFTRSGLASQVIAKYRPPCPVIVLSDHDWVLRQCSLTYGLYPLRVEVTGMEDRRKAVEQAIEYGRWEAHPRGPGVRLRSCGCDRGAGGGQKGTGA